MFYMGQEMAFQVIGGADSRFDPDDQVLFYGRSVDSLYYEEVLPDHKYTGENIYWLTYGNAPGLQMPLKDGTPDPAANSADAFLHTERQEEQSFYITKYPRYGNDRFDPADDHWLWRKVQSFGAGGARATDYEFEVTDLTTGNYSGTVSAHVVGGWAVQHGIRLKVNGTQVYENDTDWVFFEPFTAQAEVPHSLLQEGTNTFTIEFFNVEGFIDENYIDWFEIGYHRGHIAENDSLTFDGTIGVSGTISNPVTNPAPYGYTVDGFNNGAVALYDVSDLYNVQQIDNLQIISSTAIAGTMAASFTDSDPDRRYIGVTPDAYLTPANIEEVTFLKSPYAPLDLLDTTNGADWMAIVHSDYWEEIVPLVEHRSTHYNTRLVDVQRIYDQFNGGMMSSEAIRDFLAYTYDNWSIRPEFVLLGGGGTNDMRQYYPNSKPTYVPTYIYPADPILGETASDNRFAMLDGDDLVRDMHIGRFPAYAEEEMDILVEKTIRYETTPIFDDWNRNVLLISDDLEGGGGNFYRYSDTLAHGGVDYDRDGTEETLFLPEPYTSTKAYLGRTCDLENQNPATECQQDIVDAINEGALFTSYIGHAVKTSWGTEGLMNANVVEQFDNHDRLSIFLAMACFEGFFHEAPTGFRSLAETYLLDDAGAVASWSPTGFGVATGHDYLEQGLFLAVFQENITELGAAMTWAIQYMEDTAPPHKYDDLMDTFVLLGDPALQAAASAVPTAVELAGISAQHENDGVEISWQTASETDILGFELFRRESTDGEFVQINDETIWAEKPGSPHSGSYAYQDQTARLDQQYWYELEVISLGGGRERYGLAELQAQQEQEASLFLPLILK